MIIESSSITMRSEHRKQERYERSESLTMWVGNPPNAGNGNRGNGSALTIQEDFLQISEEARTALTEEIISKYKPIEPKEIEVPDIHKQKMLILQTLLEALSGKKLRFFYSDIKLTKEEGNLDVSNLQGQTAEQPQRHGWGIAYDFSETYIETERMSFSSNGFIRTADGKEISFSVELTMNRMFAQHHSISFRAGDAVVVDPLVINFNGNAAGLSEQKFFFDLTMDGNLNEISFLKPGSGFLALDLNGDGRINDGSELFGPRTGNGFEELAKYDSDGNGWIDANDPIYESLKIWTKDENGNDQLFSLGEKGVGAIYLGNLTTPFSIKGDQNQLHGQVSRTGVYVNKNGAVGTIQQVDLAI